MGFVDVNKRGIASGRQRSRVKLATPVGEEKAVWRVQSMQLASTDFLFFAAITKKQQHARRNNTILSKYSTTGMKFLDS